MNNNKENNVLNFNEIAGLVSGGGLPLKEEI